MSDGTWALVMAVVVVMAVMGLIQRDGRRSRTRGGPSGWGGYDGGDLGGHHHHGGGFDFGGGSDGGGGGGD